MHTMAVGGWVNNIVLLAVSVLLFNSISAQCSSTEYPSIANLSSSWSNVPSGRIGVWESVDVEVILLSGNFVCGFHCNLVGGSCLFAISIFQTSPKHTLSPRMVWSANRQNPVRYGATLQLTREGDLILQDLSGTQVWSTNTSGNSVAGLKLTENGNLVLFDRNNSEVWQSFDHPTDSLLLGQRLVSGQRLVASISTSDWGEGSYSLVLDGNTLNAYYELETNHPRLYFSSDDYRLPETLPMIRNYYCQYINGGFGVFQFQQTDFPQFLKLDSDGHLRVYCWLWGIYEHGWQVWHDLSSDFMFYSCGYTGVCGEYSICLRDTCSCSAVNQSGYFKVIDVTQPYLGCVATTPISCESYGLHGFLEVPHVSLSSFPYTNIPNTTEENCKQACLKNCSCKAVKIYANWSNPLPNTYCLFYSSPPVFMSSSFNFDPNWSNPSRVLVKVQNAPPTQGPPFNTPLRKKIINIRVLLRSVLGATFTVLLTIGACLVIFLRYNKGSEQMEENHLDQALVIPTRFSYEELKVMTKDFGIKLGEGGFGSVFLGTLPDGTTEVAVKQLDGFGQVNKSFLAEVQTIGSILHVNLVRLLGFCSEERHRLLVYEYMCNGSLDRCVFNANQDQALSWQCRRRIIRDIAKGLAYLHEDCSQKIYHLDIKPQNILLDENLNAKLADFGLAKLISKEETQVATTMRGTPGYMAPEWSGSVITEKVDVYSFGVVVLEILCGRKNVDRSQPEEDKHLLSIFERKAKEDNVLDMVESKLREETDSTKRSEFLEMMKVAAWCLQNDFTKRPSMHSVMKVLEGSVAVEENLAYDFVSRADAPLSRTTAAIDCITNTTTMIPSKLSGPR